MLFERFDPVSFLIYLSLLYNLFYFEHIQLVLITERVANWLIADRAQV